MRGRQTATTIISAALAALLASCSMTSEAGLQVTSGESSGGSVEKAHHEQGHGRGHGHGGGDEVGSAFPPESPLPSVVLGATAVTDLPPTTAAGKVPIDLYAHTRAGMFAPQVAGITPRVYVPNSDGHTVSVIDPVTLKVIDNYPAGVMPHHVVPSWDLTTLYALDTAGNELVPIDPRSGRPGAAIPVEDPYNLYFTPDGSSALVIAERYSRIDLRDPRTWQLQATVPIAHPGVNHGDFSPDGRYFYASCEFSGWVVTVDLAQQQVVAETSLGGQPIDVKLSPDASVLYVANQAKGGVHLLNPADLSEVAFVPTGRGPHGLYPSRDGRQLYVTNRLGGSVSVIDFGSNAVTATWNIPGGGSPDMGSVSPDGSQFWVGGRYHGEVYVFDTNTGGLLARIPTGAGPHGLTFFPQPGRYSLGHTGNYR